MLPGETTVTTNEDMGWGAGGFAGAQQDFDPRLYLDIARRRFLYFLVPAVVIFAIVYWVAQVLPPVYQARATILVESQQIPTSLAAPTVSANAAERIQLIEQRLMARDNLLEIARKYSLYAGQRLSPSEIVDQMRGATKIRQIDVSARTQPNTQAIGFTVSFEDDSASATARVTNEFVTSILQQNIQSRTNRASETARFFQQQVAKLEQDLSAQEARIVAFKNKNQGSLPETLASRQSLYTQLQNQIADIDSRTAVLETQKQLWQERGPTALDPRSNSTEAQLSQLRMKLVQLRAIYSDTHPDVRAVAAQIKALEDASALEPAASDKQGDAGDSGDLAVASDPNNARIVDIDAQLDALKAQRSELEKRLATLDEALQKTPQVEVALNVLTRDYNSLQVQYRDAKAKMAEAATGEQLEQDRQAERFEVIEQATVPTEPIKPDRGRIVAAGAFGSIAAGVGLVMLLELLDQSIRRASDLERRLNLRPFATIPYVTTDSERQRRRLFWMMVVLAGVAAAAVALVLIHLYYLPLDYIARAVVRRLVALVHRFGF
jgi:succinoglycan biosynthesis transport protein ExoP